MTARPLAAAEIWFGMLEPEWREVAHFPPSDFMALFAPDAPWQRAAENIRVFHLSKRFVRDAPEDQLRTVLAGLRSRNIKLALQGTPLLATQACGIGVEGHGPAGDMEQLALRLKGSGARVDYVAMDEPLWYGHRWEGAPGIVACHTSIPELARQTAEKMRALKRVFPDAKVGDIEPMGVPENETKEWLSDIRAWLDAYRTEMGEPLAFLQADVVWLRPTWQQSLVPVAALAKAQNIPLGIIYNGTPQDTTDAEWLDTAEANFHFIERTLGIKPAQAFLFSWVDFPRTNLPEGKRDTMTNLVLRYAAWQSGAR